MIQQLAHTAASVPSVPQSLPPPESVNVQKYPSSSGVNGSSHSPTSYRDEPRTMVRSEQRYSGYRSPESDSRSKPHFDDRDNMRGRYRGSRNRGRGDRMGHNWDERDRDQYRDIERDNRSPRSFRDRSRSRSPPRNGDRRNTRLHSPIRRPRAASPPSWKHDPSVKGQSEPGKDEFGRDIRSESPKSPMVSQKSASPASTLSKTLDPRSQPQPTPVDDSKLDSSSSAPSILSTSSSTTNTATTADSVTSELGMESFNLAMFDYTSPASWEALGKMWQVTNGYLPSTEQLMQFVMSYGQQMDSNMQSSNQEFHPQTHASSARGRGRGRGGFFRGRGGMAYGNGRNLQDDTGYSDGSTDAIVLGGGDEESGESYAPNPLGQARETALPQNQSEPGRSGRMQRDGDKWVFVRNSAMDVS